jgi:hypothetical protein
MTGQDPSIGPTGPVRTLLMPGHCGAATDRTLSDLRQASLILYNPMLRALKELEIKRSRRDIRSSSHA